MNDSFLSSTALNDTALNGSTKTADMSAPAVPELIRLADAPVEVRDPDIDETLDIDRPWVVLVWNDPINLMSYVTFVLQKLFSYSKAEADKLMMQVHTEGKAAVSHGTRSEAERDVFRLHEHGLWATMQQD